ncbi:hypothetical protein JAAARDRAFT_32877 [Jaapia argillacea MUCL 33604]|uniref:Amino acid permease/ SLC12A domain-containing protein n=1 Tax=Jaapia argillacea MUCL 33604 TaxID=933084 RepID=A0A067QAE1_9AGAM|nr:hypothetical protein JAAARDRAFT_32877 [Jaapia argillacea MUCL 33604]
MKSAEISVAAQAIDTATAHVRTEQQDEAVLAALGYKQEFKRAFTPLELFGVGFSIIGLLPSIAYVLVYAIPYGGPVAMVWGWAICAFFLICIALAMAELGSAAPTSGGLYYWTYRFSSPRWRLFLCWIVGYSNTIGNIAGVAAVGWGCAVQILAAASIGSNLNFAATTAQYYGTFLAVIAAQLVICSTASKVVARLQHLYIILNGLLILAVIIALPAATPKEFKNTAKFAFGNFTNLMPWTPGFSFVMSFLAPLWTICSFDAAVHISEEASNATVAVPAAILLSTVIAAVLGWAINVVIAFCMGTDLAAVLASPIGQPLATIFFNSFGQKGTLALWSIVVAVQFMMGTSIMTTASRQSFAFARDGALPFSRFLYRVNPTTQTPLYCVWFVAFCACCLSLLAFAGPAAIGAIFSLSVAPQYVAYSIPIVARFAFENDYKPGPFNLGAFGLPVAIAAVAWMCFTILIFFFPASPAPIAASMNYSIVVLGGILFLAILYFYFPVYGGVHWFKGPVSNIQTNEKELKVSGTKEEGSLDEKASSN